jgi:hypothetical protein
MIILLVILILLVGGGGYYAGPGWGYYGGGGLDLYSCYRPPLPFVWSSSRSLKQPAGGACVLCGSFGLLPYVLQSFRETNDGWRLSFSPADEVKSQQALNGDHWADPVVQCASQPKLCYVGISRPDRGRRDVRVASGQSIHGVTRVLLHTRKQLSLLI